MATATRRTRRTRDDEKDVNLKPMQVAKRLQIGRTHIYRLMNEGKLPFIQVSPRCRRVSPQQLEQYLKSKSSN